MKLVFVHIGKKLPKHLKLNLKRTINLFPELEVVLIANQECRFSNIPGLQVFRFSYFEELDIIKFKLGHPQNFRNNFWFLSLIRFLVLHKYMEKNVGEIIHVESDVILASDFPYEKFAQLEVKCAFSLTSDLEGIASILYLRDLKTSKLLSELTLISVSLNAYTTDMIILKEFYVKYESITNILSSGSEISCKNNLRVPQIDAEKMRKSQSHFGGIFDGIDIGFYLSGEDPRNHRGLRRIRSIIPRNYVEPRLLYPLWNTRRGFIDVFDHNLSCLAPVYSLHIHSKDLRFFQANNSRIFQSRVRDFNNSESKELSIRTLFKSITISAARRFHITVGSRF